MATGRYMIHEIHLQNNTFRTKKADALLISDVLLINTSIAHARQIVYVCQPQHVANYLRVNTSITPLAEAASTQ